MGGKFQLNNSQPDFTQTNSVQKSIEDFKTQISKEMDSLRMEVKDLRYMVYIQNSTIEDLNNEASDREADLALYSDKVASLESEVSDLRCMLENMGIDSDHGSFNTQSNESSNNKKESNNTNVSHFGDVNSRKSPQPSQPQPPVVAFAGFAGFSGLPAKELFPDKKETISYDFNFGDSYLPIPPVPPVQKPKIGNREKAQLKPSLKSKSKQKQVQDNDLNSGHEVNYFEIIDSDLLPMTGTGSSGTPIPGSPNAVQKNSEFHSKYPNEKSRSNAMTIVISNIPKLTRKPAINGDFYGYWLQLSTNLKRVGLNDFVSDFDKRKFINYDKITDKFLIDVVYNTIDDKFKKEVTKWNLKTPGKALYWIASFLYGRRISPRNFKQRVSELSFDVKGCKFEDYRKSVLMYRNLRDFYKIPVNDSELTKVLISAPANSFTEFFTDFTTANRDCFPTVKEYLDALEAFIEKSNLKYENAASQIYLDLGRILSPSDPTLSLGINSATIWDGNYSMTAYPRLITNYKPITDGMVIIAGFQASGVGIMRVRFGNTYIPIVTYHVDALDGTLISYGQLLNYPSATRYDQYSGIFEIDGVLYQFERHMDAFILPKRHIVFP
ncbi:hypothetical protein BVG19_g774 [[Candida] boidinii]|nr:hypothetical protein BVG19_g774 [[Candida] boidinii]OWB50786.1 hypothetical protein B5S27_g2339 [[Candida] boidinii]